MFLAFFIPLVHIILAMWHRRSKSHEWSGKWTKLQTRQQQKNYHLQIERPLMLFALVYRKVLTLTVLLWRYIFIDNNCNNYLVCCILFLRCICIHWLTWTFKWFLRIFNQFANEVFFTFTLGVFCFLRCSSEKIYFLSKLFM